MYTLYQKSGKAVRVEAKHKQNHHMPSKACSTSEVEETLKHAFYKTPRNPSKLFPCSSYIGFYWHWKTMGCAKEQKHQKKKKSDTTELQCEIAKVTMKAELEQTINTD